MFRDKGGSFLFSVVYGVRWDGPTLTADHLPDPTNASGIYAVTNEDGARDLDGIAVYGAVALSGVVVEGEKGYRAERATIRSLVLRRALPRDTWRGGPFSREEVDAVPEWQTVLGLMDSLAERYQVDVTLDRQFTRGNRALLPGRYLTV